VAFLGVITVVKGGIFYSTIYPIRVLAGLAYGFCLYFPLVHMPLAGNDQETRVNTR
jgi:hypothetical protein